MNAIFFKEWIKTRWYLLLAYLVSLGFAGFCLLRVYRVIEMKEASHLWEVMLTRDAIFVNLLEYIPVLIGILLAIVQFAPEMYHKCLKLTLHLPYSHLKMTNYMLVYGLGSLVLCFALNLLLLFVGLQGVLAVELYTRVLVSALPWYLAGLCSYLLVSWVCLEPTWKMRVFNLLVSLMILRVFFLTEDPEAYAGFLIPLGMYTLLTLCFSWNSILRFKCGKED